MPDSGQKTEQPTQRRFEKARKEGQFPQSRELVSSVQFLGFVALAVYYAPEWFYAARNWMRILIETSFRTQLGTVSATRLFHTVVRNLVTSMLMGGLCLVVLTLGTQLLVTQFGFSTKKLSPDLNRLNPLNRLKSIPRQNVPQLLQALVLLPLFCGAVWIISLKSAESFLRLPQADLEGGVRLVASTLKDLLWRAAELFLVVGLIDFVYQRRRWMSDLKMSKQDIREEMREVEGDPHVKARMRRLQRDLLRRRMMKDVESATAIVVNPTHFAVALRYVPSEMPAPRVVAKGKNYLAQRIRDRGRRHQVPIVENPPLAQALYKSAQVGQEIPAHLYRAVAEVLAYIYKLMNGRPGQ